MGYVQGQTVVHPQHGAAVVGTTTTKDLGDGPTEYLELLIEAASLRILIPTTSVERIGIRSLSTRKDAEAILVLLEEASDVPVDWKERNSHTTERMKSSDLVEIAKVARDLMRHERRIGKPLNIGEQHALGKCLSMLASELSLALDLPQDETVALLTARCCSERALSGDSPEPARAAG